MNSLFLLLVAILQCVFGYVIDVHKIPRHYALDVGCGDGASSRMLQTKLQDSVVIGIDKNKKRITQAIQKCGGGLFLHGDAGKENFPHEFFKYAQIKYSMIDILNKEEVIQELYLTMQKDSMLFLADYDVDHPILEHHPLSKFHDPFINLKLINFYFNQESIIYKNNIIYSIFYKN